MAKILIADDHEDVRRAMSLLLEDEGYETLEAIDGEETIEKANDASPSLILLDMAMPRMDGIEALKQLKASTETKHIPVIMVTAQNDKDRMVHAVRLGLRDFINKPWSNTELLETVDTVIASNAA